MDVRAKGKESKTKKVKKVSKEAKPTKEVKKSKKTEDKSSFEKGQNVLVKIKVHDESFWDGGKVKSVKPNGDIVVELYSGDKLTVPPSKVKKQKEKQKAKLPKNVEAKLKRYVELMDRFEELSSELNEIRKEQDDIKSLIDNKLGREFEETKEVLTDVKDRTIKILKYQRSSTPWKKMYSSLYEKVSKTLQSTMDEMEEQLKEVKDYIKISEETEAGIGDKVRRAKNFIIRGFNKLKGFLRSLSDQGQDLRQALDQMNQKPTVAWIDSPIYEVCADLILDGFAHLADEIICTASAKYKKGDRVVVDLKNEGVFLGTVTRSGARVHVTLDNGEKINFAPTSKFLIGKAQKRQRKSAIPREQINKYLLKPSKKFPDVHTKKPYPKKIRGPKQGFGRIFRTRIGREVYIPQHLDSDYRGPMPNYGPRGLDNKGYEIWNEFYNKYHKQWEKPRYDINDRWGTAVQIFKRYAKKNYDYTYAMVEASAKKSAIDAIIENVSDKYRTSLTPEQQDNLHTLVFEALYKEVEVPSALKDAFSEVISRLQPFLGNQHVRTVTAMSIEANELFIYMNNNEFIATHMLRQLEKNLQKFADKNSYNREAAIRAALPIVNTAGKMYAKEFAEPSFAFSPDAKREVANSILDDLEEINDWESVEEEKDKIDLSEDPFDLAEKFASMKRSELNALFGRGKEGSSRVVWNANGFVIKRAKNSFGKEQNEREEGVYHLSYGELKKRLAPVLAISDDSRVLIMERAEKVKRLSKASLKKLGLIENVLARPTTNSPYSEWDVLKGAAWDQLASWDPMGLVHLKSGGVGLVGDFLRPSSWGKINGKLVLIDYGY